MGRDKIRCLEVCFFFSSHYLLLLRRYGNLFIYLESKFTDTGAHTTSRPNTRFIFLHLKSGQALFRQILNTRLADSVEGLNLG